MRNALFIYPKFPPSYWSFKYALEFIGKKSLIPPAWTIDYRWDVPQALYPKSRRYER